MSGSIYQHAMNIDPGNLLFIISQPRSGSSLLQQLLMATDEVFSVPEPWLMLPLVHIYKETEITDGYNPRYAQANIMQYINTSTATVKDIKNSIRKLALELYNYADMPDECRYFLDKTPRYYHIVNELMELFPEAKYIFLTRSPESVFASILGYNLKGDIKGLFGDDRQADLLKAPEVIADIKTEGEKTNRFFLRYEDLVSDTATQLARLSEFAGLNTLDANRAVYNVKDVFKKTKSVDKKSLAKHNTVVGNYLDSWKEYIDDGMKKSLLLGYLERLGDGVCHELGYDQGRIIQKVKEHPVKARVPVSWDIMKECWMEPRYTSAAYYRLSMNINGILSRIN